MPSKTDLKRRAFQEIDARADEIVNLAKTILKNPEPGFREAKTSKLVAGKLAELGAPFRAGLALTGIRLRVHRGQRRPRPRYPGRAGLAHRQPASLRRPGNRSGSRLRPPLPDRNDVRRYVGLDSIRCIGRP